VHEPRAKVGLLRIDAEDPENARRKGLTYYVVPITVAFMAEAQAGAHSEAESATSSSQGISSASKPRGGSLSRQVGLLRRQEGAGIPSANHP
jgi:hypothetical protein